MTPTKTYHIQTNQWLYTIFSKKNRYQDLMLIVKYNKFISLDLKVYLDNINVIFDMKSVLPNSKSDI